MWFTPFEEKGTRLITVSRLLIHAYEWLVHTWRVTSSTYIHTYIIKFEKSNEELHAFPENDIMLVNFWFSAYVMFYQCSWCFTAIIQTKSTINSTANGIPHHIVPNAGMNKFSGSKTPDLYNCLDPVIHRFEILTSPLVDLWYLLLERRPTVRFNFSPRNELLRWGKSGK